jgi:hypothetical protein
MLIKIVTASFIFILTSCNSYKKSSQEANSESVNNEVKVKAMDNQMTGEGFQLGVIRYLKESECSYIIIDQTTEAQFDPINIGEDSYKAIRNDGEKVYYKYRPLRRMNRCPEANPIELIDIKKREG